jgi:acetyl-CoA carboxylase beta subunit
VKELRAAKNPYIVVLTNPTTGGVTASYAMLGDNAAKVRYRLSHQLPKNPNL